MFVLNRAGFELRASGVARRIAAGPRETLDERCGRLLAQAGAGEPSLLVGALPFDLVRGEFLYQPAAVKIGRGHAPDGGRPPRSAIRQRETFPLEQPPAEEYARMVSQALDRIAASGPEGLRKVVLARQMILHEGKDLDFAGLLDELARDPHATAYRVDLDPVAGRGDHLLIGATPELLVARDGLAVRSEPLAGSIPRGRNPAQDRERAETLLGSAKDRHEHAITVEYILDLLAPLCAQLHAPNAAELRSTASMWHLGTRIEGVLKGGDGPSAAGLAAILHPTPAVGGCPRDLALAAIRDLEKSDRGYYAGAVGYVDAKGDGEWHVALRCAELVGSTLTLHAGAGIVEGSIPQEEVRETGAKFRAMLRALGIEDRLFVETGNSLKGRPE